MPTLRKRTYEPTGRLVEQLIAVLQPKPGDEIRWEALEELLSLTRREARMRTICLALKRRLRRQHNLKLVALRAEGFRILYEYERIAEVRTHFDKSYRAVSRTKAEADEIDPHRLTGPQAEEASHVKQFMLRVHQVLREERSRLQQITPAPAPAPPAPPQRAALFLQDTRAGVRG